VTDLNRDLLILSAISDSDAFALVILAVPRLDVVDSDVDSLANETLAQKPTAVRGILGHSLTLSLRLPSTLAWIQCPCVSGRSLRVDSGTHLGPRTDANCNRRSLPLESPLAVTEIWSDPQTRVTTASNVDPLLVEDGAAPLVAVVVPLLVAEASPSHMPSFFSLAAFSADRSLSRPPFCESRPACHYHEHDSD